jgi:deoxyribodipyrimidine photo-lyase
MFENGLFIFRRDFRIVDNIGLLITAARCKRVYTIFVFTPEQVGKSNSYRSNNAIQFMIESLQDLAGEISKQGGKLLCFYGSNDAVVAACIRAWNINYVGFNQDYTPYALERDHSLDTVCKKLNLPMESAQDYYLHAPGSILNGSGGPYQKFTPYYNVASKKHVDAPHAKRNLHLVYSKSPSNVRTISLDEALTTMVKPRPNAHILVHGGRPQGLQHLKEAIKTQRNYAKTRNNLYSHTSLLSAYIKFDCVSIREVYAALKSQKELIRQIYWREFYINVLYAFPNVLTQSMKSNARKIAWHHNERWFQAWCNGETGFPVIDAGMRELNTTGYMHNRARLIVATFLAKTLLINWKKGEHYFATRLTDYDPASNNLNWQWCASTSVDSEPYYRITNPWIQSEKFDPDAEYIKKWVPELEHVSAKDIHQWNEVWKDYTKTTKYPKPICDYSAQKELALRMYRNALK